MTNRGPLFPVQRKPLIFVLLAAVIGLSACTLPASGPSTSRILKSADAASPILANVQVIPLTDVVVQRAESLHKQTSLYERLGDASADGALIGRGDTLQISIWEAPPAVLYGASTGGGGGGGVSSQAAGIPEQVVDDDGVVSVPFVGRVRAAGRSSAEIASEIERRLSGKAHQPQVIVRRTDNSTVNVTIVGDVAKSRRMPLTPKGERLLDALASAGGTDEPISKVLVQVTRGGQVASAPLEQVIRDPRQNIRLAPDDVITLMFQPYSFTALGAVGRSAEVPFEGAGLTLAQALGRIGGLQEQRSDPRGVFVFRMEYAAATANPEPSMAAPAQPRAMVPVIYQVDIKDPASFFLAQRFEIRNGDVLYVSNSPITDLQVFLGLLSQTAFSVTGLNALGDLTSGSGNNSSPAVQQ